MRLAPTLSTGVSVSLLPFRSMRRVFPSPRRLTELQRPRMRPRRRQRLTAPSTSWFRRVRRPAAELVNLLCPPVNENSLDSGLRRLKKRRQVRQDGDLYMAVDSSAAPAGSGAPSAAGDVADDRGKQRGPAQRSPAEPAGPAAPLPGD